MNTNPPTLAAQQQALLAALWADRADDAWPGLAPHVREDATTRRGLRAYRSHGRALAQRALAAAYPRVAEALGARDFDGLAHAHWLSHPPAAGDIAQWGGELASHIESIEALMDDHPRLADLARIEWALHRAAFAGDGQADLASLQLLASEDPACIALQLAPATCCIAGTLVWREGPRPRERTALPGEPAFIAALQQGRPLLGALACAPGLDFDTWLAQAATSGLLLGARRRNPSQGDTT